jgi:hypothetical protein
MAAKVMSWYDLGDTPVAEPSRDLLGATRPADTLATFLAERATLPFTLGVYGAWGEGKTTFANLLVHSLREQRGWADAKLIEFSAWPFITADSIWRALLERIARVAFCTDESRERTSEDVETLRDRLRHALLAEALPLRKRVPTTDRSNYERLVRRFDRSAQLAIRSASGGAAFNSISSIAGLAVDAAATVSPGIAPLQRLLAVAAGLNSGSTVDAPAADVVQSIEDMRDGLSELFGHFASSKLIILLDDLDRCSPEVALDVLETIKIFIFESRGANAQCLFIVAADEALIARGLQARFGTHTAAEARQYLEKIVQLRVPVPDVSPAQAHGFVAICFPEWALTTDLIHAAVGQNPRRVRQQCNVMSYRFQARESSPKLPNRDDR